MTRRIKLQVEARVDAENPRRCGTKPRCGFLSIDVINRCGWCRFVRRWDRLAFDKDDKIIRTRACLRAEKREG